MTVWFPGACGEDDPAPETAPRYETRVVCTACEHVGTMKCQTYPSKETWPKECPSCKKPALYAANICINCGATIAMKDPDSQGYGRPKLCPHCNKSWEP